MTPERAAKIAKSQPWTDEDLPDRVAAILAACAEERRETWARALTEAANLCVSVQVERFGQVRGAIEGAIIALRDRGPR